MKAKVELTLTLDPLVDDKRKIEFELRTAMCLLAHGDLANQPKSAPIVGVTIDHVEFEGK